MKATNKKNTISEEMFYEVRIMVDKRDVPINLRIPRALKERLDEEKRIVEKTKKMKMSLTDLIIMKLSRR